MEGWIWVIIFIVAGAFKLIGKLASDQKSASKPRPSQPRPRPQRRVVGRPTATRSAPPPAPRPTRPAWQVNAEQLQEFIQQVTGQPEAPPPAPPPVPKQEMAEPPPQPITASTTPVPPTTKPRPRAALWAEAMRDKQNLRNAIVAAEILGPCKGR